MKLTKPTWVAYSLATFGLLYVGVFWYQAAVSETYCLKQEPDTGYGHLGYLYTGSKVSPVTLRAFCTWEGLPSRGMPPQVTAMADLKRAQRERADSIRHSLGEAEQEPSKLGLSWSSVGSLLQLGGLVAIALWYARTPLRWTARMGIALPAAAAWIVFCLWIGGGFS